MWNGAWLPRVPFAYSGDMWTLLGSGTLGIGNGTVAAPALAFAADADGTGTGLYRIGANNIGIACNGVLIADVSGTRLSLQKNAIASTPTACLTLENSTPSTAGATLQISPDIRLIGRAWSGGADHYYTMSLRQGTDGIGDYGLIITGAIDAGAATNVVCFRYDGAVLYGSFTQGYLGEFVNGQKTTINAIDGYWIYPGGSANANYSLGFMNYSINDAVAGRISHRFDSAALTHANSKIVSFAQGGSEKAYIDKDGGICPTVDGAALPGAAVGYRGQIRWVAGGAGARDRAYICLKSDAGAYSWVQVVDGGA